MLSNSVIKLALDECEKSTFKLKIGAVVFKGKRIYSTGHNDIRSSHLPMKHREWAESLHAEQSALLNIDWKTLKGCSILVLRLSKKGKLGMCKPCPMCEKLLKYVGIKDVYYSNSDGEIVHEKYIDK